ncbi:MAG: DUF3169 family protein [bacterium]
MINKKSIYRVIFLLAIGGVFGAIFSIGLLKFGDAGGLTKLSLIGDFLIDNSVYIFMFLVIVLFLPSVYLFFKGKELYENIDHLADDEYEVKAKVANRKLDISLTINSIFMILNFLVLGTTFDIASSNFLMVLIIFFINILAAALFEIYVIRFIQKLDARLKGDPTSFKFNKEFIDSCDEAEKLKIYKSGYYAFKTSKSTSLCFIVITTIGNMVLGTGALPIFISCIWMLVNTASYGYYTVYKK